MSNHKPTATIEIVQDCDLYLYGRVYGHPYLKDGALVYTSQIVRRSLEEGVIETRNTNYRVRGD